MNAVGLISQYFGSLMSHWRTTDDGWQYDVFPRGIEPAKTGAFESLVRVWQSKNTSNGLPSWRDFDLMDFEGWWGWLVVYDVISLDPLDLRCRLWGSGLVTYHGLDATDRRLRDPKSGMLGDSTMFDDTDVEFFSYLIEGASIGVCVGSMNWQKREYLGYQALRLPLADDGVRVDKLLCASIIKEI